MVDLNSNNVTTSNPHSTRTANAAREFIRWSCRFAPAPSGETVPVWAGCTQSAHPSHTRTEAKK